MIAVSRGDFDASPNVFPATPLAPQLHSYMSVESSFAIASRMSVSPAMTVSVSWVICTEGGERSTVYVPVSAAVSPSSSVTRIMHFQVQALDGILTGVSGLEIVTQLAFLSTLSQASSYLTIEPSVDRKSTRLNSSHQIISYAVFCL